MTQGMENRTMAQCEGADDKCNICPVRSWVQQHRTLLIVCFGVLGVLLLLMLGSRKTVLNIANQPSQAGGNAAKVMVIDNHGFSMFQWLTSAMVRTTARRTAAIHRTAQMRSVTKTATVSFVLRHCARGGSRCAVPAFPVS